MRLQIRLQLLVELAQRVARGRRRRRQPFERQFWRRLLCLLGWRLLRLGHRRRPAAVEPRYSPQSAIDGGQAPRRTRRPRVAPRLLHGCCFNYSSSSMRGAHGCFGAAQSAARRCWGLRLGCPIAAGWGRTPAYASFEAWTTCRLFILLAACRDTSKSVPGQRGFYTAIRAWTAIICGFERFSALIAH